MKAACAASAPFSAVAYLQADDLPGYLAGVIADGDTRALPLALREAADVLGMAELARRTGLNRETLYRTLSEHGNPQLDTLEAILGAFGLRLSIDVITVTSSKRDEGQPAHRVRA